MMWYKYQRPSSSSASQEFTFDINNIVVTLVGLPQLK